MILSPKCGLFQPQQQGEETNLCKRRQPGGKSLLQKLMADGCSLYAATALDRISKIAKCGDRLEATWHVEAQEIHRIESPEYPADGAQTGEETITFEQNSIERLKQYP